MGNSRSKIKVMPLEMTCDEDPSLYVGDVIQKKKKGQIVYVKSGQGKQIWNDDSTYLGSFKDDEIHGNGTITYPNGSIYTGQWNRGVRHGCGKLISVDGSCYEGEWKYDEQDGKGTLHYDNGDYYVGDFKINTLCGNGKLYNSQKQKIYQGEWFNNQFHGKGKYFFTNGKVQFDGNWCQSYAHGIGIHYEEDGKIREFGVFENGVFVKDLVQEIYYVLQDYVNSNQYLYSVDVSNNLVLEDDVLEWVSQTYRSPCGNGVKTPPIRNIVEDNDADVDDDLSINSDVEQEHGLLTSTQRSAFAVSHGSHVKKSVANMSVSPAKKHVFKNPLGTVVTTNPFLVHQTSGQKQLPKVAQDIIKESIATNTFKANISPPGVPISKLGEYVKHKNSENNAKNLRYGDSKVGNKTKNGFFGIGSLFKKKNPIDSATEVVSNPFHAQKEATQRVSNPAFGLGAGVGRVRLNREQHNITQQVSNRNVNNILHLTKDVKETTTENARTPPVVPKLDLNRSKRMIHKKKQFQQQTVVVNNPANALLGVNEKSKEGRAVVNVVSKSVPLDPPDVETSSKMNTLISNGHGAVNPIHNEVPLSGNLLATQIT